MRVRLRNKRPTLHLTLRAKANIKPTQTGERTKQGQAAACVSEREREMDRYWIGTQPNVYQSWLPVNETQQKESRSAGVESGLVFACY